MDDIVPLINNSSAKNCPGSGVVQPEVEAALCALLHGHQPLQPTDPQIQGTGIKTPVAPIHFFYYYCFSAYLNIS